MLSSWNARVQIDPKDVKLLVTSAEAGDVLKARLPLVPSHPRALLTLLEGLALWQGQPIGAAWSAGDRWRSLFESSVFGDELWPAESPLVQYRVAAPGRRAAHLRGLGDFRALRVVDGGRR